MILAFVLVTKLFCIGLCQPDLRCGPHHHRACVKKVIRQCRHNRIVCTTTTTSTTTTTTSSTTTSTIFCYQRHGSIADYNYCCCYLVVDHTSQCTAPPEFYCGPFGSPSGAFL